MTDLPPQTEEEAPVDWGNVAIITQTQKDAIDTDPGVRAVWQELPPKVLVGQLAELEQADGSMLFACAHPTLRWEDVEVLLEVADTPALAAELKADRAATGGDWQAEARAKVVAAVEAKPQAQRDALRAAAKAALGSGRAGTTKGGRPAPRR